MKANSSFSRSLAPGLCARGDCYSCRARPCWRRKNQFDLHRSGDVPVLSVDRRGIGLFKKYDLDIPLVFVTPGAPSVAAILSGDSEVAVIGAASITRPFVQGNKDPVLIGGVKSLLTHSIIAKPDIKTPEQLRANASASRASAATRIISLCRRCAISASNRREVSYIQAGGAPETLAALVAQGHRRGGFDRADRRSGSQVGLSLRRLRPGFANRLRRDDAHHAPVDHRQARAGDGSLHARHG